jgi:hypothetical protein
MREVGKIRRMKDEAQDWRGAAPSGQPDEEGNELDEEMHQPGQPPTWWDPVHLASEVPEAAPSSVESTDPAGLRTPSDPAEPLPPGQTSVEAVGRDEQDAAVRWPDLLNALAAIGRFFIRSFGGV